jgi:hypothetical protein
MKKHILTTLALVFALSGLSALSATQAQAHVDVHVGIGIPAPPVVRFEAEPPVEIIPQTQVYYAPEPDYDLYRYGGWWYVNRDGYWYRSHNYNGPFGPVVYESVPHAIIAVPGSYHHHPVHTADWHRASARAHYRGHPEHHEHGHDHDHDHDQH